MVATEFDILHLATNVREWFAYGQLRKSLLASCVKMRVNGKRMSRLFALFACLALALSFTMASVSHAMEPIGCIDGGTSADGAHDNGGAGQSSDDTDRAFPHQHGGCHGHHIAAPSDITEFALAAVHQTAQLHGVSTVHGAAPSHAELRPPIA